MVSEFTKHLDHAFTQEALGEGRRRAIAAKLEQARDVAREAMLKGNLEQLSSMEAIEEEGRGDAARCANALRKASQDRRERFAHLYELASMLRSVINIARGDVVFAEDLAGTGLDDDELALLCQVAGFGLGGGK